VIARTSFDLRRGLLWCGIIAPLADTALTVFFASLHPDYDHIRQFMSELGETGRPFAGLVNAWFSVASLLLVGFGIGLATSLPASPKSRAGSTLYLVWALIGVIGGFFPCDPGCRGETTSAAVHLVLGGVASVCILPAPMLLWMGVSSDATWRGYGWFIMVIQLLAVVFSIALAAAAYEVYVAGQPLRELAGLIQRLCWLVYYSWTIVLAATLLRRTE